MATYKVEIETSSRICGGMSQAMADVPWPEYLRRQEEEKAAAAEATEEATETLETRVGFRRHEGKVCLSPNQVRSMLQEAARALLPTRKATPTTVTVGATEKALRTNLWVEEPFIFLDGRTDPDGVVTLPRTIRNRPPFERSVVNVVEYVEAPLSLTWHMSVAEDGRGKVLTAELLERLLKHAGTFVGLGAHRGLQEFGRFKVVRFEAAGAA